ncbi:PAS domain S-box protein [Paenibacillus rhizoplanae]
MSCFSVHQMMHYSLYSFAEHSPDPMYILGMDNKVSYANSSFVELYGWTTEELNLHDFPHVPRELRDELNQMYIFINQGKRLFVLDTFRIKRDGELISVKNNDIPSKRSGRMHYGLCMCIKGCNGDQVLRAEIL